MFDFTNFKVLQKIEESMMQKGILQRMTFQNEGTEQIIIPSYNLMLGDERMNMNRAIGKVVNIRYLKRVSCIVCGKEIKKSFGQGFCYPCFVSVPQTEECVFRPELCRAHEGIARDFNYARENCLVDQCVYLAQSGMVKVGVTRCHQIPTRWVDQGAVNAIKVAIAGNRHLAGIIEVELKKVFADKTNWRKMLTGNDTLQNLNDQKKKALNILNSKNYLFSAADDKEYIIEYPVIEFPGKVVPLSLEKNPIIQEVLLGIKGQYLIFKGGGVLNIRKHSGYHVEIEER